MYAVLYIPDFPLQALLRTESAGQAQPAALFAENTKRSVVLAANAPARAASVIPGMTAPQAVARCPALLIRTPNANAESDARAALFAVGFTVAPLIEDTAAGVCTIDLKGSREAAYRRAACVAVAQLESFGFVASAGIGATPLLAFYAARHAASAAAPEAATPGAASCGRHVLEIVTPSLFLSPLPLQAADPPPEIAPILATWGLRTFGDVAALARDDLGRRLGPAGLAVWDRVRGGEARPLRPVTLADSFEATLEFENEIETLEPLLFVLRRFLERLTLELRVASYVAVAVELALRLTDDGKHEHAFRLPEPTADVEILFRALQTHLDSVRTDASIVGVHLRLVPTRPLVRQQGLFDTGLRDPHRFSETLARVAAIVGSDRVGTPKPEDTHRPDAIRLVPPADVIAPAAEPPLHAPRGLPLRRYRPPLRAQLELTDSRPTYLWTERFNGTIAHVHGPWLSSGDWWQTDRAWRRTEYDVTLEHGGMYRLVLSSGAWSIEGEYD